MNISHFTVDFAVIFRICSQLSPLIFLLCCRLTQWSSMRFQAEIMQELKPQYFQYYYLLHLWLMFPRMSFTLLCKTF